MRKYVHLILMYTVLTMNEFNLSFPIHCELSTFFAKMQLWPCASSFPFIKDFHVLRKMAPDLVHICKLSYFVV